MADLGSLEHDEGPLETVDLPEKPLVSSRSSTDELSDEEQFFQRPTKKQFRCCPSLLASLAIGLILTLAGITFAILFVDSRRGQVDESFPPPVQGGSKVTAHCGSSVEEAKARGCKWDVMTFGWTHPTCFDPELSARWEAQHGPWEWYLERPGNGNDSLPLAAQDLPYMPEVWTTPDYREQHCLYLLRSIHTAAMVGGSVSNAAIELSHTDRCIKVLGSHDYINYAEVSMKVYQLFFQCVTLA